jgi:hypothetical protein
MSNYIFERHDGKLPETVNSGKQILYYDKKIHEQAVKDPDVFNKLLEESGFPTNLCKILKVSSHIDIDLNIPVLTNINLSSVKPYRETPYIQVPYTPNEHLLNATLPYNGDTYNNFVSFTTDVKNPLMLRFSR